MSTDDLAQIGIGQLLREFESRRLTAEEVVKVELELIQAADPTLNIFLCTNEFALEESVAADTNLSLNTESPLLNGIPVSVKDLLFTRNMPTTGGSRAPIPLPNPPREARAITRLREAGAILLGKTNLHEFAFGITNENEHFGACRNPWRVDRMTGGSSGGSAAAVAAGLGVASLGTDTRGSIRIPASLCGVSGLKPTLGKVPTHGVIPLSSTMDHVGPMARTVEDLEAIMAVIAPSRPKRSPKVGESGTKRLTLGVCDYYFQNIQVPVEEAVRNAIRLFEEAAVEVVEVDLPILPEALHASDIISRAEAVSIHDNGLTNTPEDYGPLVRGRLATGYEVSGLELVRAYRTRERTIASFQRAFSSVDFLAAPAVPVTAPPLGTQEITIGGHTETIVNSFVRLNAPQNVAGIPAIVIPCGFDADGLPIGLQLMAWRNRDDLLIELGKRFQGWTTWHRAQPSNSRAGL